MCGCFDHEGSVLPGVTVTKHKGFLYILQGFFIQFMFYYIFIQFMFHYMYNYTANTLEASARVDLSLRGPSLQVQSWRVAVLFVLTNMQRSQNGRIKTLLSRESRSEFSTHLALQAGTPRHMRINFQNNPFHTNT